MDTFKLRLKIGADEFEAEGSQEYVQKEREVFLESIAANELDEVPNPEEPGSPPGTPVPAAPGDLPISVTHMGKLARQDRSDKDLIVLTALPQENETQKQDALVLLLLAHRVIRNVENVKTTDILNGMKQSGITVDRLDGVVDKIPNLVLRTGVKKGTKYRLSSPGVQKAVVVGKALLSHVS